MCSSSYLGGRFGHVEGNLLGGHRALHLDLTLSVYKRQAGDGHLRWPLGSDGPQPGPDPPRGLRRTVDASLKLAEQHRHGPYPPRGESRSRPTVSEFRICSIKAQIVRQGEGEVAGSITG